MIRKPIFALIIILALLGGGYVFSNRDKKDSNHRNDSVSVEKSDNTEEPISLTDEYRLIKEQIKTQSSFCSNGTADFTSSPEELTVVNPDIKDTSKIGAVITENREFSKVVFGCTGGSQAEVAVLEKVESGWSLTAEDASYIMACSKVDFKNIPTYIIDPSCYENENTGTGLRKRK